jgi:diguanylate cyclase (GGDEF)-like protein
VPTDNPIPGAHAGPAVEPALNSARRLSAAGLAARSADDVTAVLVEELRTLLELDAVQIFEVSQDLEIGQAIAGMDADEPQENLVQVFDERPSGVALVVASGESLHVPDAKGSPDIRQDLVERWNVASLLLVPVIWGGGVRFVVVLVSQTRREFPAGQIALAETLAGHAALALALHESVSSRAAHIEQDRALTRAARALNASLVLEEVLETLTREANRALDGTMAGVYLADGSGSGRATAGHNVPDGWTGLVMRPGEGVGGQVLVTGRPAIANAYQTQVVLPDHSGLRLLQTAVAVPMAWNGELKGALSVGFANMRRVNEDDVRTLEAIAELAVVACRNAEAYEAARVAASTDALTGLLNHGALQVRTREEVARAGREHTPLSCLILDLDDFKAVNDARGHMAGDELLRGVAQALTKELREYDLIARYGGDEFVVLLPGAVEATARLVADRVSSALARPQSGEPIGQCSVGVAEWSEPLTAAELLDLSDRALRLAKRSGKGRVAVAGAGLEQQLELLQASDGSTAAITREFWEMVAGCESGRDALLSLPRFLRRTLSAEEVALYELAPATGQLSRTVNERAPDDSQPLTFTRERLQSGTALSGRLGLGAVSRPSLDGLLAALGIDSEPGDREAPAGAYAAIPLTTPGGAHGLIAMRAARDFSPERLRMAELIARHAMTVFGAHPDDGSPAAVQALAGAIEVRDNYTHEHSEQVVSLAAGVARGLGLGPLEIEQVCHAALLHDVGKLAIPNEILHKPGPLTNAEWKVMAEHPVLGERILLRTPQLEHLAPIVRHEHERWDGGGYPDGLAGNAIPVASRIILACDAYNAMITTRPYRVAMSEADAVAELRAKAGTQFDPTVVHALLDLLEPTRLRGRVSAAVAAS